VSEPTPSDSIGCAVLGGGPAGLTGAHALAHHGVPATVLEADGAVGGIAKTVRFGDFRFDLGGHRFYTRLAPVQRFWEQVMEDDWLVRDRLSRIYFGGRFFNYPLRAQDVFGRLGMAESIRCGASWLRWRRRMRGHEPQSFDEWVVGRFGRRIYETFFESYTEKVWGIPGYEIQSEWAAQRIQNFSVGQALLGILGIRSGDAPTLIERFHYPRLGPGQLWERLAERLEGAGTPVRLNHRVVAIRHERGRASSVIVQTESGEVEASVESVLSTIPLNELVEALEPAAPPEILAAARKLRYRHLCLVALMTDEPEPFPDNWIYLHDPGTRAGRVQNFGAWSPDMVRPGTTCLGAEYFCDDDDEIWRMDGEAAVALATEELARIGLVDPDRVIDGVKVNVPKAYPMYDASYRVAVAEIRGYLEHFENLRTCGRNGLHRYNNQDHSMWTAVIASRNLARGGSEDVWSVTTSGEYLERAGDLDVELAELEPAG
jgi:protoporphyrinogen oxidase